MHELTALPRALQPAQTRPLRRDQPDPPRGHPQPARRGPGRRGAARRLPEHRVRVRAGRRARGHGRGGAAQPRRAAAVLGGDASDRRDGASGARRRAGGPRAALRLVLRPRHLLRRGRQPGRATCASAASRWSAAAPACSRSSTSDDAAEATVAAVERGAPGVYNVVDDEPAALRDWLPAYAEAIGAPPPRRVPVWLARLVAGKMAELDERAARRLQREGQAGARLAAALEQLARGLPGSAALAELADRHQKARRARRTPARSRSPRPPSAASGGRAPRAPCPCRAGRTTRSAANAGRRASGQGAKVSLWPDERRVRDDRGSPQGARRRRLPGGRVDRAGVLPGRAARQAGAGRGPGGRRQDRAGQGASRAPPGAS